MNTNIDLKSNTKFLFVEIPKSDESFDSFIVRNALCNYLTLDDFLINCSFKNKAQRKLQFSNTEISIRIRDYLFLSSARVVSFQNPRLNNNLVKLLKPFLYSTTTFKKAKMYPSQYCAECLRMVEPYFRLSWENSLNFSCIKCRRYLNNGCNKCGAPIILSKAKPITPYERNQIARCYACNYFLGSDLSEKLTKSQVHLQQEVNKLFLRGETKELKFLIAIIKLLLGASQKSFAARRYFEIDRFSTNFLSCSTKERYQIIKIANYWMNNRCFVFSELNRAENYKMNSWRPHFEISTYDWL